VQAAVAVQAAVLPLACSAPRHLAMHTWQLNLR
jgi:hypothetical protein